MKPSDERVDDMIREALTKEDAARFDELGELSVPEQLLETFRGRNRWLAVLSFSATALFFVLFVFAAIQFFNAEAGREMARWGAAAAFFGAAVTANKLWYWGELNRQSLQREIKRVELQLARLAQEVRGGGGSA